MQSCSQTLYMGAEFSNVNFLFFNATNKIKSVSCLPELQDKFERTNPLFVLYILIAPMDLMKTSPRRNVNISTLVHKFTSPSYQYGKEMYCSRGRILENNLRKST